MAADPHAPDHEKTAQEPHIEAIRRKLVAGARRSCPPWLQDQVEDIAHTVLVRLLRQGPHGGGIQERPASYFQKAAYSAFGACQDGLDSDRTDTQLDDLDEPAPGTAFIYLITADDGANEGTLGFGSSAERSNFSSCP